MCIYNERKRRYIKYTHTTYSIHTHIYINESIRYIYIYTYLRSRSELAQSKLELGFANRHL